MFRSAANVNIYFLNDYFNAISFNGVSSYLILTIKYYRSIFIFFPMCTFLLEFMIRGQRTYAVSKPMTGRRLTTSK